MQAAQVDIVGPGADGALDQRQGVVALARCAAHAQEAAQRRRAVGLDLQRPRQLRARRRALAQPLVGHRQQAVRLGELRLDEDRAPEPQRRGGGVRRVTQAVQRRQRAPEQRQRVEVLAGHARHPRRHLGARRQPGARQQRRQRTIHHPRIVGELADRDLLADALHLLPRDVIQPHRQLEGPARAPHAAGEDPARALRLRDLERQPELVVAARGRRHLGGQHIRGQRTAHARMRVQLVGQHRGHARAHPVQPQHTRVIRERQHREAIGLRRRQLGHLVPAGRDIERLRRRSRRRRRFRCGHPQRRTRHRPAPGPPGKFANSSAHAHK